MGFLARPSQLGRNGKLGGRPRNVGGKSGRLRGRKPKLPRSGIRSNGIIGKDPTAVVRQRGWKRRSLCMLQQGACFALVCRRVLARLEAIQADRSVPGDIPQVLSMTFSRLIPGTARLDGFRVFICATIAVGCAFGGRALAAEPLRLVTNFGRPGAALVARWRRDTRKRQRSLSPGYASQSSNSTRRRASLANLAFAVFPP